MPSRPTIAASLLLVACASTPKPAPVTVAPPARVQPATTATPPPACRMLAPSTERATHLALARAAHAAAPTDRVAALALARCTHLAADLEKDDDRVVALTDEGMAALAKLAASADDAEVAYVHALNLGLYLRARGMLAVGRLSELVARLKVAERKPDLDDGGPLRVLGLLYVKAPGWPMGPGDLDAALEVLRRAVTDFPEHPQNHLYLAHALIDAGDREQARAELGKARALCVRERFGDWADLWRGEVDLLMERNREERR